MGYTLFIPASHPLLDFLNTAYAAGKNTNVDLGVSLGNIKGEDHSLDSSITDWTIPTLPSSETMEYDTDGVMREITISGDYQAATAVLMSQWILTMEALENFGDAQSLNLPYRLAYTLATFPSYPYTNWIGTTGRSLNVIVESFKWSRSEDTPTADLVYYTLKLKERAVDQ